MTKNEIQMMTKTYELEKAMRSIVDSRATHSNSTTNNMSSWGQMNHEIIKKKKSKGQMNQFTAALTSRLEDDLEQSTTISMRQPRITRTRPPTKIR